MEITTLRLAASALRTQQTRLDTAGHNIANLETTGFRSLRPELIDLPADPSRFGETTPPGLITADDPNRGVTIAGTRQPDVPGSIRETGAPLDLALPDGVYLEVRTPDGQTAYTRDGHLELDAQGTLNVAGRPLANQLRLPPGDLSAAVDTAGRIVVSDATGSRVVGTLPLVRFGNPEGLEPLGLGLLQATPASGAPRAASATNPITVRPGALEASNVQLDRELTHLLRAQRAYQAGAQLLRTWDELAGQTVREIGH